MKKDKVLENVKIVRKYFDYLRERKGYAQTTIDKYATDIAQFEKYSEMKNFKAFNSKIAKGFKNYIYDFKKRNGTNYSVKSRSEKLKSVREFLLWLYDQPGYRSHLNINYIKYLQVNRSERNAITSSRKYKKTPKYADAWILIDSIPNKLEIDRRDKALISLSLLTGLRPDSIRSLCIKNIDIKNMIVILDTLNEVDAKFGKYNEIMILPFDLWIYGNISDWISELINKKEFMDNDPVFPKTEMNNSNNHFGFKPENVTKEFWKNTGQINKIFRERAIEAGVTPHTPYGYRRLNAQHARRYATNMEEYSAISQNLGHSETEITEIHYGNMGPEKRKEILEKMQFDITPEEEREEEKNKLDEVLNYIKNKEKNKKKKKRKKKKSKKVIVTNK